MKPIQLLLVGDLAGESSPLAALSGIGTLRSSEMPQIHRASNLKAAQAWLETQAASPDLIVLCESRPGEHDLGAIERLRRLVPLARLWRVLGSWSEGEQRSGHPPAGCPRSYWYQWAARWGQELERMAGGETPSWAQPLTAATDEWSQPLTGSGTDHGLIVIVASRAENAAALAAPLRHRGHATLLVNEDQQWQAPDARLVVWDTPPHGLTRRDFVAHLRARADNAALLALVTFPRGDDLRQVNSTGVSAVLAKPYRIADLYWHVDRLVGAQPALVCPSSG